MASISLGQQHGISTLKLDDGKVNAFSPNLIHDFNRALDEVSTSSGAVVIAGRRNILSAGFDLMVVQHGTVEQVSDLVTAGLQLLLRIASFPRPVVVATSGHAIALGALLLLVGDHRIGTAGPYKIAMTEVAKGIPMPSFIANVVMHYLPTNHARKLLLFSDTFAPDDALRAGILDEMVDDALEAAQRRALTLSELPEPAFAKAKYASLASLIQQGIDLPREVADAFGAVPRLA